MKRHSLSYFEPNVELDEKEVKMPEAAVEMDEGDCVVAMMENHGWGPVEVDGGRVIGQVQVAKLCQVEPDNSVPVDGVVSAMVSDDFSEERLRRLKGSLKLDLCNLSRNEAQQLEDLVIEWADVFAFDPSEFGSTKLVTHSIDTGDSPPIKQPAWRIPFALHQTVEEMVQTMLE